MVCFFLYSISFQEINLTFYQKILYVSKSKIIAAVNPNYVRFNLQAVIPILVIEVNYVILYESLLAEENGNNEARRMFFYDD